MTAPPLTSEDQGGNFFDFARAQVPGRRCVAVKGAGSDGAGLTRLLADRGKWVVEVDRPKRPARRGADRQLNRALHAVALVRLRDDLTTAPMPLLCTWIGLSSRRGYGPPRDGPGCARSRAAACPRVAGCLSRADARRLP